MSDTVPPLKRFMRSVLPTDNGCWEWSLTHTHDGYARIGSRVAHRVGYELLVGPIPAGLELDHLCCNPGCVNPTHLEPVTHAENRRRARREHCIRGHPRSGDNLYVSPDGSRNCRECNRFDARTARKRKTP